MPYNYSSFYRRIYIKQGELSKVQMRERRSNMNMFKNNSGSGENRNIAPPLPVLPDFVKGVFSISVDRFRSYSM
ncbi:MAG: hypothetical protein CVT49_13230 [candidate division Zixibacteria bacterium HGW-Zixibacteria-1]|nr:MAG: hypothetical protein CVT49_13230 [candidate division Zixibacteria bacterium HGW-Zixibacteria-1]